MYEKIINTALYYAVCRNSIDVVTMLIEAGADVDKECNGRTALMEGAYKGFYEVVDLLCKKTSCDVNSQDFQGFTALMLAAQEGHIEILDILLKKKALVDTRHEDGDTALIQAAE